MFDAGT